MKRAQVIVTLPLYLIGCVPEPKVPARDPSPVTPPGTELQKIGLADSDHQQNKVSTSSSRIRALGVLVDRKN